jgi:c-di-AMP phosphodiesterase-like protein
MFVYGNNSVIIPDLRLQHCFQTSVIFINDILNYCREHVIPVTNEKSIELLNEKIYNEMYINVPDDIIYSDPSSIFWLHPDINSIITKNQKIVFTWSELNHIFLDYVTTPNEHFIRKENSIFFIDEKSELRNIFKCQYFHQDQLENIIKQITKFLGKVNSIEKCCPKLKFTKVKISTKIFNFIDQSINNYNRLLPNISAYIEFPNVSHV